MRTFAILAAACLALALGSCTEHGPDVGGAPHAMSGGGQPSFLGLIAEAPFRTKFHAHRRVWQQYQALQGPQTLEYTEEVWSDGQGGFAVTPEQLLSPQLSPAAQQVFLLLQKSRESFVYRLRDFRIRELQAFLTGYQVQDLGGHFVVAGQSCERLQVTPTTPSSSSWELDVLPSNGLVLAVREYSRTGQLVSSVETLEYDTTKTNTNVHQDLPTTSFTAANAQQVLGFADLQPRFVPGGFQLTASEKLAVNGENWARYSYTDGAETFFVLHHRDAVVLTDNHDPAGRNPIRIFQVGRWTVAQASLGRDRLIALGRQPANVLADVLASMRP